MTGEPLGAPLLQIGGVMKDSVDAAAEAIVKVATCSPIPEVAVAALRALTQLTETKNTSINNCDFTGNPRGNGIDIVGSEHHLVGD